MAKHYRDERPAARSGKVGWGGREDSVFREVVRKSLFAQIIKIKAVTFSTAFFYGFFTAKLIVD